MYHLSLKKRLWAALVLLVVICTLLTGAFSYYFAYRVTRENAIQLSQNTLNKSVQVMDESFKHIVVSASTIMISEPFKQMMQDVAVGDQEGYFKHLSALQVPFTQMKLTESSIDSILISTPIGDFYPTNTVRDQSMSFRDTDMYKLLQDRGPSVWVEAHRDPLFIGGSRVVTLLLEPYVESSPAEVYIVINIKEEMIKEIIYQNMTNQGIRFLLLNGQGEQAVAFNNRFSEEAERLSLLEQMTETAGYFPYGKGNAEQLVNYSDLRLVEDWKLISLQPMSDLLREITLIKWLIVLIIGACILLALPFSGLVSDRLLRPLYKLQSLMHKVEHNDVLDVRFDSRYQDEVTQVGQSFNRMITRLDELIQEVKVSEQEKRKSENKALQAQIDPHFLYNTLNTILWKSETAEHQDVRDMIMSLSRLFQLGLNNGQEMTTLEKELEHVRQYLSIQQKCYEGLFTYEIEVTDQTLLYLPMVKILLQPLVENSILHGFKDREKDGLIQITVSKEQGRLNLKVEDNGSGMDVTEISRCLNQENGGKTSYALSNIHNRLLLYYGPEASMQMHSIPDVLTSVSLVIPLAAGDEKK